MRAGYFNEIRCVKDINQYWERLSVSLSYFNRFLQRKAEYGSNVSEKGIQGSVLFTAKEIARERNMNEHLVSSLCQAVAYCFPEKVKAEIEGTLLTFIEYNKDEYVGIYEAIMY